MSRGRRFYESSTVASLINIHFTLLNLNHRQAAAWGLPEILFRSLPDYFLNR